MNTVKAVKEPEADPKQGKTRPKSAVSFPYFDLATSLEVAKAMHETAGGLCDRAQLAVLLGYSGVNNGSFSSRVSAAKSFGLIDEADDGKLRVTSRARAIVAPVSESQATKARVDAFLSIELFKKIYETFSGGTLPEQVGLRNLLATEYGVVGERVNPTVRVLMDSAEQAGLFKAAGNRTRMVMPFSVDAAPVHHNPPPSPPPTITPIKPSAFYGGGGGGSDEPPGIDPALIGLLRKLPPAGTALTEKKRNAVIAAFTAFVDLVYPEDE